MHNDRTELLQDVARYYAEKLAAHGESPRGVDWNGEEGQVLRFAQLCKLIPEGTNDVSLLDLGCGYGAMLDYLRMRLDRVAYHGIDVSEEMVRAAEAHHAAHSDAQFSVDVPPGMRVDYSMASGIFNVRLHHSDAAWQAHLHSTLDLLDRCSRKGFAFNCLTSYSDEDRKRSDLYYADPCGLFDLCKRRYAKDVALLHDYGLYEFTILVRKAP
ncbi:MAG: class I SAM-dependent methyltransferase [Pseudorhodoferax sp.]